jgi:hypothetical protein
MGRNGIRYGTQADSGRRKRVTLKIAKPLGRKILPILLACADVVTE